MEVIHRTSTGARAVGRGTQIFVGTVMLAYPLELTEDSLSAHLIMFGCWLGVTYFALVPRIVAGPDALVGDSVHFRYTFPWSALEGFEAAMGIIVRIRGGQRVALVAVQRAQAAVLLGRESVVDRVTAELNRALDASGPHHESASSVHRRLLLTIPAVLGQLVGVPTALWMLNLLLQRA